MPNSRGSPLRDATIFPQTSISLNPGPVESADVDGAPLRGSEQGEDLDLTADTRERVADERARVAEEDLAGLRTAMDTRAVIEQAKGMIMITLKVDADAAFEVLVRRSQTSHVKLSDVAQEIVAKGMQP